MSVLRRGTDEVDECWVAVEGELDDITSQKLGDELGAFMDHGCRRLVVDLRRTVDIGSTGIRVLIDALRTTEELGRVLVLRAPPGEIYELGRVRRLAELLANVDDAVEEVEAIRRLDQLFA
ncbi:MAG: STAS domain-containing protein [Actinobacteria bacterium]|nr:STAS domain-containing protein [Actinomycetota bacterium]